MTQTVVTYPNEHMWEQRYRPVTLDQCILPEADMKVFRGIVEKKRLPHLILHSKSPGTGKTTLARVLCNEVDAEYMFYSGGNLRIDQLRNELTVFASSKTRKSGGKVIIIDEADNEGMRAVHTELRSWMEAYSINCSVIMTCNNIEVLPAALRKSRARTIQFGQPSDNDIKRMKVEMIKRCIDICEIEGVPVEDKKVIATLVGKNFPDLRACVTTLDRYAKGGVVDSGILSELNRSTENLDELIEVLKTKQFGTALRTMVPKYALDYNNFVTLIYKTLIPAIQPASTRMLVKILAENQKYANIVPNLEIHLYDMLIDIGSEVTFK